MPLVRDQILLGGDEDDRISCSGPSVALEPQAALHLALVLHELGTNARKYGALSVPGGRLAVSWEVHSIRSEEHTSELQSLMRISYAVFCLKKKKQKIIKTTNKHYKDKKHKYDQEIRQEQY